MTLNLTVCQSNLVIQASDRRFVDVDTRTCSTDSANKAIVVGCKDALTSITFCGVGTFRADRALQRIDCWLARQMQESGIPELGAEDAAIFTAERATKLFATFTGDAIEHSFILAAYGDTVRSWVVSNRSRFNGTASELQDKFEIQSFFSAPRRGFGMLTTGLDAAFSRPIRRRMLRRLAGCRNVFESEAAIIEAMREAASDPRWSWGIGRDFMVVTLHPDRLARATFYPEFGSPHAFGPVVLWNTGLSNALITDADVLPGDGYRVAFGGEEAGFKLAVGRPTDGAKRSPINKENPLTIELKVRISHLKYGPKPKPGDEQQLMSILRD